MLELNTYSAHEIKNLKDFFLISYVIIDDIYNEIITIAIVGELHGTPSEKSWFNYVRKNFKELFPNLGDRTRFNRTRGNLFI